MNGWDLQHGRRVRWRALPQDHDFGQAVFTMHRFGKVDHPQVADFARRFINSPPINWQTASLPALPPEEELLTEVPDRLQALVGLALDFANQNIGEPASEDEMIAHFVVPFFRALGWPPEQIAFKWHYVDVALFGQLPRKPENWWRSVRASANCSLRRACRPRPTPRLRSSWATPGTRSRAAKRPGSTLPGNETLCGRIIAALKADALLNEGVGAGYIDRNWPPALKESATWPLASLRQSFLNGALTRLIDPDGVLKTKLVEFIASGDFGLASGPKGGGSYERLWYKEPVSADEVAFDSGVVLLKKSTAEQLRTKSAMPTETKPDVEPEGKAGKAPEPEAGGETTQPGEAAPPVATSATIRLTGNIQPELWNRLGTRVIPKLRSGRNLKIGIEFSVTVDAAGANDLQAELRQVLADLDLQDAVRLQRAHNIACEK